MVATSVTVTFEGAVEGAGDEAVLRRLLASCGGELSRVHGMHGKEHLLRQLSGYNNAAKLSPWVVLVDLDSAAPCVPLVLAAWLPSPAPLMRCRLVVQLSKHG